MTWVKSESKGMIVGVGTGGVGVGVSDPAMTGVGTTVGLGADTVGLAAPLGVTVTVVVVRGAEVLVTATGIATNAVVDGCNVGESVAVAVATDVLGIGVVSTT